MLLASVAPLFQLRVDLIIEFEDKKVGRSELGRDAGNTSLSHEGHLRSLGHND